MGTEALTIVSIASTVLSAAGQVYTGVFKSADAKNQAKQAKIAGQSSMLSARQQAAKLRSERVRLKGKQAAQQSASGGSLGSSNLVQLQTQTDKLSQEDITNVLSSGRMSLATSQATAGSYNTQASGFMTAGMFNAGSSILGGTMNVGKIQGWEGFED